MTQEQKALKLWYGRRLGARIFNASSAKQRILKTHRSKPKKVNWWYEYNIAAPKRLETLIRHEMMKHEYQG